MSGYEYLLEIFLIPLDGDGSDLTGVHDVYTPLSNGDKSTHTKRARTSRAKFMARGIDMVQSTSERISRLLSFLEREQMIQPLTDKRDMPGLAADVLSQLIVIQEHHHMGNTDGTCCTLITPDPARVSRANAVVLLRESIQRTLCMMTVVSKHAGIGSSAREILSFGFVRSTRLAVWFVKKKLEDTPESAMCRAQHVFIKEAKDQLLNKFFDGLIHKFGDSPQTRELHAMRKAKVDLDWILTGADIDQFASTISSKMMDRFYLRAEREGIVDLMPAGTNWFAARPLIQHKRALRLLLVQGQLRHAANCCVDRLAIFGRYTNQTFNTDGTATEWELERFDGASYITTEHGYSLYKDGHKLPSRLELCMVTEGMLMRPDWMFHPGILNYTTAPEWRSHLLGAFINAIKIPTQSLTPRIQQLMGMGPCVTNVRRQSGPGGQLDSMMASDSPICKLNGSPYMNGLRDSAEMIQALSACYIGSEWTCHDRRDTSMMCVL